MLRSMYAGVSGLRNFQSKLDVIGNNIANVNTNGFKKSRVNFKDFISQEVTYAQAPNEDGIKGGVNPRQVGLGSTIASIDTVHTQGSLQSTNRPLDLAISGDGFFVVGNEETDERYYTRSGNFYLDDDGYVVNSDGFYLFDQGDAPIQIDLENAKSYTIGQNGTVTVITAEGESEPLDDPIGLVKFANPGGLEKAGNNLFRASSNSGEIPEPVAPGTEGTGELIPGALEMSNVDLSEEFTEMITAQRGFQANTRIITTSDEILQELVNLKR